MSNFNEKLGITPAQKRVFDEIKKYIDENECSPSVKEIADNIGITEQVCGKHVRALHQRGRITRASGRYRSIEIA